MRKIMFFGLVTILFNACTPGAKKDEMNPLLNAYDTPFDVPPFEKIKTEHFLPAFKEAMERHNKEIDSILMETEEATFENTIEALDYSGLLINDLAQLFYNLLAANTSDELQKVAQEVAPLLSSHSDNILLNSKLFEKVKQVYETKEALDLKVDQLKLLEDTYKEFVRGGANLNEEDKERLKEINGQLSVLILKFGDNVLSETNKFELVIDNEDNLAGLPESSIAAASEAAGEKGLEGKWVFTIHKPSLIPFLQYSEKRDLREKMFKAYINQGNNNDELDNKEIIKEIVSLRIEAAHLLGYETHADYVLEENMAKTPQNVYKRLELLWKPALKMAKVEMNDLQEILESEGNSFKLEPWDWWFYAEKLRKQKYDFDDQLLRPYFELENVKKGLFDVTTKLFDIQFKVINDIPKPHPDAVAYEVLENDGSHIGVLYQDFHPRASKEGGAWMDNYLGQFKKDGKNRAPVITMVMNFTKPTADRPSLLTMEEVETMFHEFGHVLHGMLSKCTYPGQAGTNTPRDFVEFPSQVLENWAFEPEVLKSYALHYETGEPIPDELIEKMENSKYFNQGFGTVEYLAASFLDMDWHTLKSLDEIDVMEFENNSMNGIGLMPEIVVRYRSPYFRHVFAGGYSSGYYSYIWSEMLDADAFEAFKENGIFDPETARSYRENILEKGGSEDPMKLYIDFRGKEPEIEPLLRKRGLLQ